MADELQTAWGLLRRTPLLAASHLEPATGERPVDLRPIEWTGQILGERSAERVFLLRHLQWVWAGTPIRRTVEAGAPVWEHRRMSWSTYCRKRRDILATMVAALNARSEPPPRRRDQNAPTKRLSDAPTEGAPSRNAGNHH